MKRTDHRDKAPSHQTTKPSRIATKSRTNRHCQHLVRFHLRPLSHAEQADDIPTDIDTMKLSVILLSICLAAVMAAPEVVEPALKLRGPGSEAITEASDLVPRGADGVALFDKRGCNYNTGCRSIKNAKPGKYCGYCKQVAYNHPWIGSVSLL